MSPIKIFNDPVHGFIEVPRNILLQLIDHPFVQRLKNIRQLGLSTVVYYGAIHTRFSHALGAMHLTQQAMKVLMGKGVDITSEEYLATSIAILLHDLGHAPFSHALENILIENVHHEQMSLLLMHQLDAQFEGKLKLAIDIFQGQYVKKYLHQLISGQLDMDRMDFLIRDSFFTGVQEGIIGSERIIKTLSVYDDQLVVEQKGIYSVEKFLVARRLMYWQVYLHKTALVAESMLLKILIRAKELYKAGNLGWCNENLAFFFSLQSPQSVKIELLVAYFTALDDIEILYAIKQWQFDTDRVLSELCQRLLYRKLLKIIFVDSDQVEKTLDTLKQQYSRQNYTSEVLEYFVYYQSVSNAGYLNNATEPIYILKKDGTLMDILTASDLSIVHALSEQVTKHFICYPG